jgi:hypothetical protein
MLNPNSFMLARAIHERRVVEARQRQRNHPLRTPSLRLLARLQLMLGNRLIDLGQKLKTQTVASAPANPALG